MKFPSKTQASLVLVAMTPFSKTMGEEMNNKYWLSSERTPPSFSYAGELKQL
jgi:hypothetical protein